MVYTHKGGTPTQIKIAGHERYGGSPSIHILLLILRERGGSFPACKQGGLFSSD
jgi:hypothetical protein